MSSNKSVKEAMIRRYGNKCFIERLKLRDTSGLRYTGCGQLKRMKQLTYHHIRMKSQGGKATIENGALLSAENHQWFHKQSKPDQTRMNEMFQELKRQIDREECRVEFVEEIRCPFEAQFVEVSLDEKGHLDLNRLERIKQKERKKEKRDLQRIKKEWEDR